MAKLISSENLLYLSFTVLLIVTSILLLQKHNKYNLTLNVLEQRNKDLISCRNGNVSTTNALQKIMELQWNLEGKQLKKNLILRDMKNREVSFDSLINSKDGKVIILRFSWSTCEDCQVQEMKLLRQINNYDNIMVIVSYKSVKDFILYMKAYGFTLTAYHLEGTETMLKDEENKINNVFCFITDGSYKVSNVHIGNVGFPLLSEAYYKIASKKLREHAIF